MVRVANGWPMGSWGQCCQFVVEVGEVVGRIGCVEMMEVDNGGCYRIVEVVGEYEYVVEIG
jgi:hypothetical protein